jgi:hypothetical protein
VTPVNSTMGSVSCMRKLWFKNARLPTANFCGKAIGLRGGRPGFEASTPPQDRD